MAGRIDRAVGQVLGKRLSFLWLGLLQHRFGVWHRSITHNRSGGLVTWSEFAVYPEASHSAQRWNLAQQWTAGLAGWFPAERTEPNCLRGCLSGGVAKSGQLNGPPDQLCPGRSASRSGRACAGGASRSGRLESEVRRKRRESAVDGKNLRKKNQRKMKSSSLRVY